MDWFQRNCSDPGDAGPPAERRRRMEANVAQALTCLAALRRDIERAGPEIAAEVDPLAAAMSDLDAALGEVVRALHAAVGDGDAA